MSTNNKCISEYTLAERKKSQENREQHELKTRRECDLVSMERKEACGKR